VEGDVGGQLRDRHGEQRRRQVGGDAVPEIGDRRARPPDVDLDPLPEQWHEKSQALQVIEMEVGQEDVHLGDAFFFQLDPERPDPGAGVEDEDRPVGQPDLDARRVPPVVQRVTARCGQGSPAAPDPDVHTR
jgi:hypothetical protein